MTDWFVRCRSCKEEIYLDGLTPFETKTDPIHRLGCGSCGTKAVYDLQRDRFKTVSNGYVLAYSIRARVSNSYTIGYRISIDTVRQAMWNVLQAAWNLLPLAFRSAALLLEPSSFEPDYFKTLLETPLRDACRRVRRFLRWLRQRQS